ncbi:hypothetical protein RM423_23805, partial [Jatrophihabitans sp. DSM 44399]|nr:hypothetical protein [Jatrophihabitans sp. DSM 44399]
VVLRTDDPLARRDTLHLRDLADRRWFQLPEGTDSLWRAYWNGNPSHRTPSDGTLSDGTLPNGTLSDGTLPNGTLSDGTLSNGTVPAGGLRDGPVVRTVHECLQAVLWNGTIGLTPLADALPDGLTSVPLADMPPSRLVVAWNSADANPLVRSFAHLATAIYRSAA